MPVPWLRLMDGVLSVADILRLARGRPAERGRSRTGGLAALPGRESAVTVPAVVDRDFERLEIERRRLDEERLRAERAMRAEFRRQSGDREIMRLRVLAAMALVSLLGSLVLAAITSVPSVIVRVALGAGWLMQIVALAAALSAQASLGRELAKEHDRFSPFDASQTAGGIAAPWLIVAGLASVALGMLVS